MNRIIISITTILIIGITQAEYKVQIPIEQNKNGPLQNNSIIFINEKTIENWIPYTALEGSWIGVENAYDCYTNTPDKYSVNTGETFIQSGSCKQYQSKETHQRIIDEISGEIKIIDTNTIYRTATIHFTQEMQGEKTAIDCKQSDYWKYPSTIYAFIKKYDEAGDLAQITIKWGIGTNQVNTSFGSNATIVFNGYKYSTLGEPRLVGEDNHLGRSSYYYDVCREPI